MGMTFFKSDDKRWTVYEHISPSGKRYVGITSRKVEDRWRNGNGYAPSNPHNKNKPFWNAIQKYGWENIQHKIIAQKLTKLEACLLEKEYIKLYRKTCGCYNATDGGDGVSGFTHNEETKKILKQKCSGKNNARYGVKLSDEEKNKIGKLIKEYYKSHNQHNCKTVYQYDKNGNFIKSYNSATQASKITKINRSDINECCRGTMYIAGNFQWSYEYYENIGKYIESRNTPVNQYDLSGNFIKRFDSAQEAAILTLTNYTTLINCCRGNYKTANDYIWTYDKAEPPTPQKSHKRKVNQYDKKTNELIASYSSIKEIVDKYGYSSGNITSCCQNKLKTAYGYIWKYVE